MDYCPYCGSRSIYNKNPTAATNNFFQCLRCRRVFQTAIPTKYKARNINPTTNIIAPTIYNAIFTYLSIIIRFATISKIIPITIKAIDP